MKQRPSLPGLLFSWRAAERRGWYLFVLGLTAIMFVGGTLLLFQVVYPATRPMTLTPQRIWLLDPTLPDARQVIAAAADKDFLLLGKTAPDAPLPAVAGQTAVLFSPSFKGHTLKTQDLLETRNTSSSLPRLFRPQKTLLPTLPQRAEHLLPASRPHSLCAVVTHGLQERSIIHPVTLADLALPPEKTITFRIAVSPSGQVRVILPLTDAAAQPETYRSLQARLVNLRFSPRRSQEVEWGSISFQWQEERP